MTTPFTPQRKRLLTIPVLKMVQDQARYVKITDKMHLGKEQKAKPGEKAKEPAVLVNCINLEDGAECQIIVSAVVRSVLNEEYPGDKYVGLCFAITKRGRNPGKQYNQFDIEEIEDPAVQPPGPGRAIPRVGQGSAPLGARETRHA